VANTTALILDDVLGFARLSPSQSNAETAVATVIRLSVPVALLIGLLRIRSPGRPWPTSSWHSTGRPVITKLLGYLSGGK
jgi:hypothetical protein